MTMMPQHSFVTDNLDEETREAALSDTTDVMKRLAQIATEVVSGTDINADVAIGIAYQVYSQEAANQALMVEARKVKARRARSRARMAASRQELIDNPSMVGGIPGLGGGMGLGGLVPAYPGTFPGMDDDDPDEVE